MVRYTKFDFDKHYLFNYFILLNLNVYFNLEKQSFFFIFKIDNFIFLGIKFNKNLLMTVIPPFERIAHIKY